jgi:hypothetical protein
MPGAGAVLNRHSSTLVAAVFRLDSAAPPGRCSSSGKESPMRDRPGTLLVGFFAALLLLSGVARAYGPNCAPAKLRAAGKKATMKIACYRRALQSGSSLDTNCIARAEERFVRAFAAADARGGCATTGDAGDVEAIVDQFVADLVAKLTPSTTTSTSTTTSSSTNSTTSCGTYPMCAAGPCGSNGEFCQVVPTCVCGGPIFCACSASPFTTCTQPTCTTTSTTLP